MLLYSTAHYILNATENTTNLKLQKLVYFSFGFYAGKYCKYLFDNRIEARQYGPVIPDLYEKVKKYSNTIIPKNIFASPIPQSLDEAQIKSIDLVVSLYGKEKSSTLVTKTHIDEGPWQRYYKEGVSIEIPKEAIKEYYKTIFKITDFVEKNKDVFETLAKT